jgi:hypothetical protein
LRLVGQQQCRQPISLLDQRLNQVLRGFQLVVIADLRDLLFEAVELALQRLQITVGHPGNSAARAGARDIEQCAADSIAPLDANSTKTMNITDFKALRRRARWVMSHLAYEVRS